MTTNQRINCLRNHLIDATTALKNGKLEEVERQIRLAKDDLDDFERDNEK